MAGGATFVDKRAGGTGGVSKMTVRNRGNGVVDVLVSAWRTTVAFTSADAPYAATVVLGGAAAGAAGECGEITFSSPPILPACAIGGGGAKVICK
jgi:hypothetical protein